MIFLLAAVAVVGVIIASWMTSKPVTSHQADQTIGERVGVSDPTTQRAPSSVAEAPVSTPTPSLPEQTRSNLISEPKPKVEPQTALEPVPTKKPKEPLRDPVAREALAMVGVDPAAEAYWLGAIFDASLPENEREDLMEDLNEDGLSDRKNPGPQDLPLIMSRLILIEEILPFADDFMVTHLGEAYKDLVNLANITQGGGAPLR